MAVSGGGDSVALLQILSQSLERDLIVYHFDHALQSASKKWAELVSAHSDRLGLKFRLGRWESPPFKPKPSQVRRARHQTLARLMEEDGVHSLCLGHTVDDNQESALMRQMGSTIGQMSTMSIHPLWPEGRGKFLYRPLIGQTRVSLRQYLKEQALSYIDDPANELGRRGQARRLLSQGVLASDTNRALRPLWGDDKGYVFIEEDGEDQLWLSKNWLNMLDDWQGDMVLKVACVVMGGGDRLATLSSVHRIRSAHGPVSLCGSRIKPTSEYFRIEADRRDQRLKPRAEYKVFKTNAYPKLSPLKWKQWRFEAALGAYLCENATLMLIYG